MSSSLSHSLPQTSFSAHPSPHPASDLPSLQDGTIPLSEIVSALSFALDLTEGAVPGHALRACLLGVRIGIAFHLPSDQLSALYYALLLKDIGCSSNSARMAEILVGDEREAKAALKLVDWTDSGLRCAVWAARYTLPGGSLFRKAALLALMKRDGEANNVAMFRARCERGGAIARKIGLSAPAVEGIYRLDEHWNGMGFPDHIHSENIPILARILALAQHLDVFATRFSRRQAIREMHARSARWFDPALVAITDALHRDGALWEGCHTPGERSMVLALEPGEIRRVGPAEIDAICEAFAEVVDAKSPSTYNHSVGVMQAANRISGRLHLSPERRQLVYRAALLHDLGKLRIPNSILDKPASLTPGEWTVVREHPQLSGEIIQRVGAFLPIARIASRHHERLDGTGYPGRLSAADLSLEDRIVAAADVFGTITERRPYRDPLTPDEIRATLDRLKRQHKLDPLCCDALQLDVPQDTLEDDLSIASANSCFPASIYASPDYAPPDYAPPEPASCP